MILTRNCDHCGTQYAKKTTTSLLTWAKSRFCSRRCRGLRFAIERCRAPRICLACGVSYQPKDFCAKYCSPQCAKGRFLNKRGEKNWNWKGGRHVTPLGYVRVWMYRDHPWFAKMADAGRYVMEHRLVMAEALGRALERTETVHHINGNRGDNSIDNLELRVGYHGKHQRVADLTGCEPWAWAKFNEVIKLTAA